MSIEIDVLNGDASWARVEPLHHGIFGPQAIANRPWAHLEWAHADLRVLLDDEDGALACHVGIYFRTIAWNGHPLHVGGIGGVMTREGCRRRGYASVALDAALQTIRANEAVRFALLFCEAHNFAFYQARGWHPFAGDVFCEQGGQRVRFDLMAPFVFDIRRAPRDGTIDLNGLPW